jgi:ATP-dependent HslUV protease, peptidase subunit HslV
MHMSLSANLIVADPYITVMLDGSGNCIEVDEGVVAIGSGGLYAQSAAQGMLDDSKLTAE